MGVLTKRILPLYIVAMAKQAGAIFIEGTIDDLCFYKMDGRYYVRMKSSLSSKKFWKDKAFEGSRKSCSRFAEGNQLASRLYRMVEEEKRVYSLFCFLKKKAIALLKEGKSLSEAEEVLFDYLIQFGFVKRKEVLKVEEIKKEKYMEIKASPVPVVYDYTALKADSS